MIPPLVRLPATLLDHDAIDALARCVELAGQGRTVVLGDQRATSGAVLDGFVDRRRARGPWRLGTSRDRGRASARAERRRSSRGRRPPPSCSARATCSCSRGAPRTAATRRASSSALFTEGAHTVTTPSSSDRRRAQPPASGRRPAARRCAGARATTCSSSSTAPSRPAVARSARPPPLPAPAEGVLVVVEAPLDTPAVLAAALAR